MKDPYVLLGYVSPDSLYDWLLVPKAHKKGSTKRTKKKRNQTSRSQTLKRDRDLSLRAMWSRWEDRFGSRDQKTLYEVPVRSSECEKIVSWMSFNGTLDSSESLQNYPTGPLDGIFPPGE